MQPVRHGQLRRPNGMRQVDIQQREMARRAAAVVFGLGRVGTGRMPEAGPVRLVDAGAGTHDVDVAEFLERDVEHVGEGGPRGHVRLDEDGARGLIRAAAAATVVLGEESLCFGPEAEVCEDDVAVAGEEEGGEGEVDAGSCAGAIIRGVFVLV